jgi:hypothetical protein
MCQQQEDLHHTWSFCVTAFLSGHQFEASLMHPSQHRSPPVQMPFQNRLAFTSAITALMGASTVSQLTGMHPDSHGGAGRIKFNETTFWLAFIQTARTMDALTDVGQSRAYWEQILVPVPSFAVPGCRQFIALHVERDPSKGVAAHTVALSEQLISRSLSTGCAAALYIQRSDLDSLAPADPDLAWSLDAYATAQPGRCMLNSRLQATEAGCTFRWQSPCALHTAALTVGVSTGADLLINCGIVYAGETIARPQHASLNAAGICLHTISLLSEGVTIATILTVPSTGANQDSASIGLSNIAFIVLSFLLLRAALSPTSWGRGQFYSTLHASSTVSSAVPSAPREPCRPDCALNVTPLSASRPRTTPSRQPLGRRLYMPRYRTTFM